jgi:nucleoside-diphosphate-sugar epimerase
MKALLLKQSIKLTPGNQRRDFVYVEDIAYAYFQALKLKQNFHGDIFNLGSGFEESNDEIVKTLFKITKEKTSIQKGAYPKRSWDTSHWVADISKTKKILKWKPKYSLNKGIQKTYSWFKKNLSFYK